MTGPGLPPRRTAFAAGDLRSALTDRQRRVLGCICDHGMTYREAGTELGIHEQTVKNHVSQMLARTGAPATTVLCTEWGRLAERERGEEVARAVRDLPGMRADRV